MPDFEAIYQAGVFRPLKEVNLPENQRVLLSIRTVADQDVGAWLTEVREFQKSIIAKQAYFPDSTLDIAADRVRDISRRNE
jgi:predicted DNA-binding antitoxin AbrB/MazE fold protein